MARLSTPSPLKTNTYLTKKEFFFDRSKLLAAQIEGLYDFLWPAATAIWNLRWQVKGYIEARGDTITNDELNSKFASDQKILQANLYRSCVTNSWEDHLDEFRACSNFKIL